MKGVRIGFSVGSKASPLRIAAHVQAVGIESRKPSPVICVAKAAWWTKANKCRHFCEFVAERGLTQGQSFGLQEAWQFVLMDAVRTLRHDKPNLESEERT